MEARTLTRPAATLASLLRQQATTTTTTPPATQSSTTRPPPPLPSTTPLQVPPGLRPPPPRKPLRPLRILLLTSNILIKINNTPSPALNVPSRGANPRYHLSKDDVAEIRKLRAHDPDFWSVSALARKFDCSETFITICTPAPREHTQKLAQKLEAVKGRWGGIRTKAREDRSRRKEMLFRGEL
ncbi:uncharacterized protein N0V96_005262 [Colletotrichum fioriniae]|uniref:uncharacterized protein n=1 Tax=Colletotrichum fioriniae TaxID=710243 RepID=UPI0032DA83C6|nr:hypothetical protein N0V96_005262 [Colletotrichum fioriniae]